ncbi:hypothetical protein IWX90DRAFT_73628 [Phyllosticta citrichinensis]|uniref:Uncharacterized protein n=1 Tax=Phyllosticta citrichinensis TaxID=1130410 RepID=A0ABR1XGE7_9PEZI
MKLIRYDTGPISSRIHPQSCRPHQRRVHGDSDKAGWNTQHQRRPPFAMIVNLKSNCAGFVNSPEKRKEEWPHERAQEIRLKETKWVKRRFEGHVTSTTATVLTLLLVISNAVISHLLALPSHLPASFLFCSTTLNRRAPLERHDVSELYSEET